MIRTEVDILLVEDNPSDAELALRAFNKQNLKHKIHHVKDGVEALEYIFPSDKQQGSPPMLPKVIFLDLKLPKLDGFEVLRRLRSNSRTKSVPIVILTSSQESKDVVESYNIGANSYIVKPLDFDKFVKTVSESGFYWLFVNKTPTDLT